jgi:hypothetical protein
MMRRKLAALCRRLADWLDPTPETVVDRIFPLVLRMVTEADGLVRAGSIKRLVVMKQMERVQPDLSRLDINTAIERAVRTLRGGH